MASEVEDGEELERRSMEGGHSGGPAAASRRGSVAWHSSGGDNGDILIVKARSGDGMDACGVAAVAMTVVGLLP